MSWHVKVIANRYADSVKLMGIARGLRGRDGVDGCEMGMGTAANLEALEARGVAVEQREEWNDPDIGRFARIHDPEGNPIELWEPLATPSS